MPLPSQLFINPKRSLHISKPYIGLHQALVGVFSKRQIPFFNELQAAVDFSATDDADQDVDGRDAPPDRITVHLVQDLTDRLIIFFARLTEDREDPVVGEAVVAKTGEGGGEAEKLERTVGAPHGLEDLAYLGWGGDEI